MFNYVIQSRVSQTSVKDIHILFLFGGILITSSTLQHNHYAAIIRNHYDYYNQIDTALCRLKTKNSAEKKVN